MPGKRDPVAHAAANQRARERRRAGIPVVARCGNCGAELAPPGPKGGKPRKWCSERCRDVVRGHDGCPLCGQPKKLRSLTCNGCKRRGERRLTSKQREARERLERLWKAGLSSREIERAMGWKPKSSGANIHRYRAAGLDLPYRYRVVAGRRVAA